MSETKPKLIIGLGNIGAQYDGTRHNSGFMVLDALAQAHNAPWQEKAKFKASIAELQLHGQKVILAKPTTFYNASGEAAQAIASFYKLKPSDILVIHDELDLPFGTIRTRIGGSSAGNNGIKSLAAHLGEAFARIRIGIANESLASRDAAEFVLERFNSEEQKNIAGLGEQAQAFIETFVRQDKDFAHTSTRL